MMKKFLAVFLCFALLLSMTAVATEPAEGSSDSENVIVIDNVGEAPEICGDCGQETCVCPSEVEVCDECNQVECICCTDCYAYPCECESAVETCPDCSQEPCVCTPKAEVCDECNQVECICCTDCGAYPCECAPEVETCPDCSQEPCECAPEVEFCPVCNTYPCECEPEVEFCPECNTYPCECPEICETCGQELCECCEDCGEFPCECVPTVYEQMMAAANIEELFDIMMARANLQDVLALTTREIEAVAAYARTMPSITGDAYYFEEIMITLGLLPNSPTPCEECDQVGGHAEDCPWVLGQTLASVFPTNGQLTNKTYTMTANETLGTNLTVPAGVTATIDLKGYVLKGTGSGSVITIEKGGTLTITDSRSTAKHYGTLENRSREYEDGGVTTDRVSEKAVWVYSSTATNGTLIEGGIITGGKTSRGGGIRNYGTLNFNGGTIVGCEVTSEGGGLYCDPQSVTTFNGGSILYNWAASLGGGLMSRAATIDAKRGKIDHNVAGISGGGICIYSGTVNSATVGTTFTMYDGFSISYNRASGSNRTTGNGGGAYIDTSTFNFNGGVVSGNKAWGRGGGIDTWKAGSLTLSGKCIVTNNQAGLRGGGLSLALYSGDSDATRELTINGTDVVISGNQAPLGGGISAIRGNVIISAGTISGNVAKAVDFQNTDARTNDYSGGGVYVERGSATINGGTIEDNEATDLGGAVYVNGGDVTFTGGEFSDNEAQYGGGVYIKTLYPGEASNTEITARVEASVSISGGKLTGNTAAVDGGAIYLRDGTVTMTAGQLGDSGAGEGNSASNNGGALYVKGGTFALSGGSVVGNVAAKNGGAAYVEDYSHTYKYVVTNEDKTTTEKTGTVNKNAEVNISGTVTVADNAAQNGGAIYVTKNIAARTASVTMSSGTVQSNSATESGGAVYVSGGSFTMSDGTIGGGSTTGNTAKSGGAVYVVGGNFTMTSGTMSYNTAEVNGGAVSALGGSITIGVQGCSGEGELHTVAPHKAHPKVVQNNANAGGGFYVGQLGNSTGAVTLYCGTLNNNEASAGALGSNVYMSSGNFTYHGGEIGEETNPGIVVVGGQFDDQKNAGSGDEETPIVYHSNDGKGKQETVQVRENSYINLPNAETSFETPWSRDGHVFVGWATFPHPSVDSVKGRYITEDNYTPAGGTFHTGRGIGDLYAVWVPTGAQTITYVPNGNNDVQLNDSNSQNYYYTADPMGTLTFGLKEPTRPGYSFEAWQLTPNEKQDHNWGKGEKITDGRLRYGGHFGDITLTAQWTENQVNISYEVVGPTEALSETCATITRPGPDGEPIVVHKDENVYVVTGTVEPVTATAEPGFKIVGWYLDPDCEQVVVGPYESYTAAETLSPDQDDVSDANGLWTERTYYVKVDYAYGDLKIRVSGIDTNTDQSYIFAVKSAQDGGPEDETITFNPLTVAVNGNGEVIIKDVPVGKYTVTEYNGWSWRYEPGNGTQNITIDCVNVDEDGAHIVVFTYNSRITDKWLNNYAFYPAGYMEGAQSKRKGGNA